MNKLILLSIFLNLSCSKDTFKKSYSLSELRVLAINAGKLGSLTQAEFDAGDTVVVTPYVSDIPNGETVTATIETCTDPGVAYGAEPSCLNAVDRNTSYANLTLNMSGQTGKTAAMSSFNVTIPSTILSGRSTTDQYNGVNYLVTIQFSVPSGKTIKAYKRLPVTIRTTKNTNPTIGSILFNSSSFTTYPSEGDLSLSSSSTAETYSFKSVDGSLSTLTENQTVAWYVSDGEINFPVTNKDETTRFKPATNKASQLVIVAVIRDGRGGSSVTIKTVP